MPQERPDDDLREAATHVAHEIRMLVSAWKRHRRDRHAYVGWFVHCRVLMEFFGVEEPCPRKEWHDDVCAWHFFDTEDRDGQGRWETIRARADRPADWEDFTKATDKLAAHLTYRRIAIAEEQRDEPPGRKKMTPSAEVTEYLLGLARLFLRKLPDDRVGWFGALDMV